MSLRAARRVTILLCSAEREYQTNFLHHLIPCKFGTSRQATKSLTFKRKKQLICVDAILAFAEIGQAHKDLARMPQSLPNPLTKEYSLNHVGFLLLWFKVYSQIKGFWKLWHFVFVTKHCLQQRPRMNGVEQIEHGTIYVAI